MGSGPSIQYTRTQKTSIPESRRPYFVAQGLYTAAQGLYSGAQDQYMAYMQHMQHMLRTAGILESRIHGQVVVKCRFGGHTPRALTTDYNLQALVYNLQPTTCSLQGLATATYRPTKATCYMLQGTASQPGAPGGWRI